MIDPQIHHTKVASDVTLDYLFLALNDLDNGTCVVWLSLQRSEQKMGDPDAVLNIPVLRGVHDPHIGAVLQDLSHPVQSTEPVQDRYSWGREE
ncbi:hypothetical protein CEXT_432641 [Caerostris extrusa]|uniref:Uncharacterized protein n=1 Tax=Caerostris extrusa TaxID=172846 RepID=A0AAV4SQW9_CAEEX|nr:hypothetical protein CEXT_432641 [Caerostris extrusa]